MTASPPLASRLGDYTMDPQTLTIALRGAERLLIVLCSGLCVWLGYRLFQSLPAVHGSSGQLELPSAKLVISKVGPGVFFALFGALILWQAVLAQLKIDPTPSGARVTLAASSGDPQALRHVQSDVEVLNCLAQAAPEVLGSGAVETALHNARIALLATVWQPAWGGAAFTELQRGQIPTSGPVAEVYRSRHQSCPNTRGTK